MTLQELQIGWIDYSSEHRNKVLAVLHALSAPEAVDEIGIGIIRDGFANILFPGTSTIQTRAKYFFIVPYILMELEKEKKITPKKLLEKLSEIEIDLIDVLNQDGAKNVIGARAGKRLKRKPSSIYWNGLRTYGIFKHRSLSLDGYAKAVSALKEEQRAILSSGFQETESASDDPDVASDTGATTFWRCLIPDPEWKQKVTINLNYEEAKYLKDRIIKAPRSKDSLLAYALKYKHKEILKLNEFEAIETMDLPPEIKADYDLAIRFSKFIYGANLRYNMILTNGENGKVKMKWEEWWNSSFVQTQFEQFNYYEVIHRLNIRNVKLRHFLRRWKECVQSKSIQDMDQLIIAREIELKTKERSKLNNSQINVDDDRIRGGRLEYRFNNTKQLMKDIDEGLSERNA